MMTQKHLAELPDYPETTIYTYTRKQLNNNKKVGINGKTADGINGFSAQI